MEILEKLAEHKKKEKALKEEAKNLRIEFSKYITNKEIPLADRWEVFIAAPRDLKKHEEYIITAKSDGLKYVMDKWFDAPEVYGRGKQIYMADVFVDCVHHGEIHPSSFAYRMDEEKAKELLTQALEEVLSNNLGSFCYDW